MAQAEESAPPTTRHKPAEDLMARNFRELEDGMRPEARARAKARAKQVMAEMLLSQIREAVGLTQEEVAATLGIRQPTLSRMESQGDM